MKKRAFGLALVAILFAFGLALTSCGNNCGNEERCRLRTDRDGEVIEMSEGTDCDNEDCRVATGFMQALISGEWANLNLRCNC